MPESCFMLLFRFHIFVSPALNHSLSLSNEISLVSLSSCEIVQANAFPTSFKLCCRNKKELFTSNSSILVLLCANNNIQPLLYHVTYLLFNASLDTYTILTRVFLLYSIILRGLIEGLKANMDNSSL